MTNEGRGGEEREVRNEGGGNLGGGLGMGEGELVGVGE